MKCYPIPLLFPVFLWGCYGPSGAEVPGQQPDGLPDCEWCGAMDAPAEPDWQARMAGPEEPGEPLVLSGTVLQPDGRTPAAGILVYAYHTNAAGIYPRRGDETGNGRRHGYLRAWVRTDEQGRYRFRTVRPAPYPSRNEPAHVHMTLTGPDFDEYWIPSTLFAGDPLISEPDRFGRSDHIIRLEKDAAGVWQGRRNVVLKE